MSATSTHNKKNDDALSRFRDIPETNKTQQQIEMQLVRARTSLLQNAPFFGLLATRMKLVDSTTWLPTLATDGYNFYYNKNFVDFLSHEETVFGFAHEVLHCVYDHLSRRQDRDSLIWNFASDFVVNGQLIEENIGKMIEGGLYNREYAEMTSEEVYKLLMEEIEKTSRTCVIKEHEDGTFDVHFDDDNDDGESSGNEDGNEEKKGGGGGNEKGPKKWTAKEKAQIKEDFKNAAIQAAKAAKSSGNIPKGVARFFEELLNPKLDWRAILDMQIKSLIQNDFTWMRPSRKGLDDGFYLPGMNKDTTVDVVVAIDTSGSICEEMLRDFLTEIKGIMDQYTEFKIHMFAFDTEVHNPVNYSQHNMEEFTEYKLKGFGGTDFECCYEYMKKEGIVPKKFIMFTDGYPYSSWGDETYCETLFIVHGSNSGVTPESPFGITVPYNRD